MTTQSDALRAAREALRKCTPWVGTGPRLMNDEDHTAVREAIILFATALHQIDAVLAKEAKASTEPPPLPPSWLPAETFYAMSAAAQVAVHPPLAEWQANLVVMAVLAAMPPVQSEVTEQELQTAIKATGNAGAIKQFWDHDVAKLTGDELRRLAAHFINVGRRG